MENEMIERVARAIYEAGADPIFRWDYTAGTIRRNCRAAARAAIEAMRQPTDETLAAVEAEFADFSPADDCARDCATNAIDAMIDAALAPTKQDT